MKLRGINNVPVSTTVIPTAPGLPVLAEILDGFTPPADDIGNNRPTGTYLHLRFKLSGGAFKDIYYDVSKLVDVYKGGQGVVIENNTVSVKLSQATKALGFDADGGLWVRAENLISKAGGNGLSAVDGGLFAHALPDVGAGLALENGQLKVKLTDVPHPALVLGKDGGLVLKLNPLVSPNDGNKLVVMDGQLYVSDSDMDTTYEAGDGLALDGTTFRLRLVPGTALAIAKDGRLTLKLAPMVSTDTGNKLTVKDGKLFVDNADMDTTYEAGEGLSLTETTFAVKLSADTHALAFSTRDKGLVVLAENLVSGAEGNALRIEDNHLYVPAAISKDTVAAPLYIDSKGKLAINKNQLIDPNGPIVLDPKTGKLTIDTAKLEAMGVAGGVSADEGNNLKAGSDGKPYYPSDLGNL